MKQKKPVSSDKKPAQAFYMTNNPVKLNELVAWEARNFFSPLREPEKPRTIALCSEFARHSLLKHFPGMHDLRDKCRENNVSIEYEYGFYAGKEKASCYMSLAIHTDPNRPFNGFRKRRSKEEGLPVFSLGISHD